MGLSISADQLRVIETAQNDVLLGIILENGSVFLQAADPTVFLGHPEWLALVPMQKVKRGFSLGVKEGRVVALFPMSRLNPCASWLLEDELVQELKAVLPTGDKFTVYRY